MKITAIMVALNEAPFIATAISAIYPFVDRIFIQTGYDRSWNNQRVQPDGTVEKILGLPDPDGKIALLIRKIPDEAIARNMLMRMDHYDLNHAHHNTVGMDVGEFCKGADYYWVIDGDEIYDPRTIGPLLEYLKAKKPDVLSVRGLNYFKTWNYVVDPSDNFYQPGFVKAGVPFQENRLLVASRRWRLLFNKYTRRAVSPELETRVRGLGGVMRAPEEIAVFHHAAYVGDDARIQKKIQLSVHRRQMMDTWFNEVWKKWTPEMKNLHPSNPPVFPGLKHVVTKELPPVIREAQWPDEYIQRLQG